MWHLYLTAAFMLRVVLSGSQDEQDILAAGDDYAKPELLGVYDTYELALERKGWHIHRIYGDEPPEH